MKLNKQKVGIKWNWNRKYNNDYRQENKSPAYKEILKPKKRERQTKDESYIFPSQITLFIVGADSLAKLELDFSLMFSIINMIKIFFPKVFIHIYEPPTVIW